MPVRDTFDMFDDGKRERGRFGEDELKSHSRNGPKVTGKSDLIDIALTLHQDNPLSIGVTDPGKPTSKWIWLPKSQIEYETVAGGHVVVTMPEWLAVSKGLA